ncbi:Inositol-1-monophosphatase [Hyella patelloides LEGE 07179]|uniref:inositol-phosphate phosphatase n=1 Tax=Hyella patelloides LEGE 07179 TaxID=945734 RepID=A0A563VQ46_9CYAN|nr:inositol monophosphatase family protein [Hyella patelloides]VEP13530.1 Inositol-1-monophosphatase [Hyella patelloides LEGE 07179]
MKDFWKQVLNFCQQTTQEVSDRLMTDFGKIQAEQKEDGSLVTKADKWADRTIREAIQATFPSHGVLTEETTHVFPDTDWCWIVDPIDGTTNFTRGVPVWGISLGLLYKGTPVFGFVYIPCLKQAFHGFWYGDSGLTGDTGAYLNNQPIFTSKDDPSPSHLFNLCARSLAILQKPFPCKIRMIGVASYNILLVAAGAAIGGVEATPKIWDIAAVWVIVQAAGGSFVNLDGAEIFPLKIGKNYGNSSFPSLVVSRQELISTFKPLASVITQSPYH